MIVGSQVGWVSEKYSISPAIFRWLQYRYEAALCRKKADWLGGISYLKQHFCGIIISQKEAIRLTLEEKVRLYCEAIHTQDTGLFRTLWSDQSPCTLISVGTVFTGYDTIVRDFLIGGIQAAYERIDLIPEKIDVTYRDAESAIVTFSYHTECIRRKDRAPFGIAGIETQVWKLEDDWRMIHLHYSKV